MKSLFLQNRIFLSLYGVFLLVGLLFILRFERGDEIIYFSSVHTPLFNRFFIAVTRLAEFPLLLLIAIIAFLNGFGKGVVLLLTFLVNGALTQFLKIVVFAGEARPIRFFENKVPLNLVQGIEQLQDNSLPSGHTSGAFAVFFMLSIFSKDKRWSYVYFFIALLIAVSRVYLLQHFLRDVYFGSLLGVLVASLVFILFVESKFYHSLKWKDKNLRRS